MRTALHLKDGDELAYAIENGRVVLTRVPHETTDDPFGAFGEWIWKRIGRPLWIFDIVIHE